MEKSHLKTKEQREAACQATKKWRAAHLEQAREVGRRWYAKHRQRERQKRLAFRKARPAYQKEHGRQHYLKHREKILAKQKVYYETHREERGRAQTCRLYGITLEQYAALGSTCNICGATRSQGKRWRLHIDHCHETGRVRGLLCHGCNLGLGGFRNNVDLLLKAAEFLRGR